MYEVVEVEVLVFSIIVKNALNLFAYQAVEKKNLKVLYSAPLLTSGPVHKMSNPDRLVGYTQPVFHFRMALYTARLPLVMFIIVCLPLKVHEIL